MVRDLWFFRSQWHYVTGMGNILRLGELDENQRVTSKHPKLMSGVL